MTAAGPVTASVAAGLDAALTGTPRPGTVGPARPAGRRPASRRPAARTSVLPPAGPQPRPGGQVYQPRIVGGHEDIALLRAARSRREHVLLYGPPGTGKTALAEGAFAGLDGTGLETIVCTADTSEADLVGTFIQDPAAGTYRWMPGPLHRSVLADVPLFVDEIALADPRVLPVLYGLMDGRGVLRITASPDLPPVPVGPGWFVIAACNPDVPGACLSDAMRDRFAHHILVDSDWQLARELGVPADVVRVAKNLDKKRRDGLIGWSPQLRTLLDFTALSAAYGTGYAAASLAAKAPAGPDRDEVVAALRTVYPDAQALCLGPRFGS